MANEGFISLTGGIKVSDINSVRNTNSDQTRACNQSDTSFNESLAWFRSNAAIRCYTASENLSASEFRGAQVMTACICTITESYAYYYANNNRNWQTHRKLKTIMVYIFPGDSQDSCSMAYWHPCNVLFHF